MISSKIKNFLLAILGLSLFLGVFIFLAGKPVPFYADDLKAMIEEEPYWRVIHAEQNRVLLAAPIPLTLFLGKHSFISQAVTKDGIYLFLAFPECEGKGIDFATSFSDTEATEKNLYRVFNALGEPIKLSNIFETAETQDKYFYYTSYEVRSKDMDDLFLKSLCSDDWSKEKAARAGI